MPELSEALKKYKQQVQELTRAILIVGQSGSGKTFAARNLPNEETAFINIEDKPLPFEGKFEYMFNPVDKKMETADNGCDRQITKFLNEFRDSPFKYIFIDSISRASDLAYAHGKAHFKGWDSMNYYNDSMWKLCLAIKAIRGKFVICTALNEIFKVMMQDGSEQAVNRVGMMSQDWTKRQIESQFTYVLFTDALKQQSGPCKFRFCTTSNGVNSAKMPPKLALDMYTKDNDVKEICDRIEKLGL